MKVAIIGATGFIGHYVLHEALDRGHEVTAIVHHTENLPLHPHLNAVSLDILKTNELTQALKGMDAVISCYNNQDIRGAKSIIEATKGSHVKRLLEVGDAGCFEVKAGVQLVDSKTFPKEWKNEAIKTREALYLLEQENDLDWSYLSPPVSIIPGVRTGHYREGKSRPIVDDRGDSRISSQDYAVAMINELESPKHIQESYTVGY